jgi:hypothetical protein
MTPTKPNRRFGTSLAGRGTTRVGPRPYRSDLTPLPSPLRPHCLAHDRLRLWRPLTSRSSDGTGPYDISDSDLTRILDVISVSWATGTRSCYGTGLLVYHVFCDSRGFPEALRCPALPTVILTFIASCAGSYAGPTLANFVFAIRAWHILHGLPWNMCDAEMKAILSGAHRLAPPSSKRPKRAPMTVSWMERAISHLDLTVPLDAAVAACLSTTFYSVARTGEFTVPSLKKYDPAIHVKRSDIRREEDRHGLKVTVFALPRTKCSLAGEDVYWARQPGPSDPDTLLENHFLINDPPQHAALFSYRHANGLRPLTKHAFMDRLTRAAESMGDSCPQGHGIRIGSTLEFLLRGVPFDVMKSMGRWSSDAFTLYLRKHAVIMAPYMQNHPLMESFTRYTMPPLRC